MLLALDWAQAFDSIGPASLIRALQCFGIPDHIVEIISDIFKDRKFFVRMDGNDSNLHTQNFGIVQGCPLSAFLFSIAMTCLIYDADILIKSRYGDIVVANAFIRMIFYADDILIIEVRADIAQEFMDIIRELGKQYGLCFNESRLEVLAIHHDGELTIASGESIKKKEAIVYLGSLLSANGRI